MEIKKQFVTPALASKLLKENSNNRNIKKNTLNQYVNDILNDNWKEDTGEIIKISKTNKLLDGQHRLTAIVKANKGIYLHIGYNINDDVFDVIDTGTPRTAGDVFTMKKIKNAFQIPAIISQYVSILGGLQTREDLQKMTNKELMEVYQAREEFWQEITNKTIIWYKEFAKILTPSIIGGFYSALLTIYPDKAEDFMNQLCSGNDIKNKSISKLRTILIDDKVSTRVLKKNIKNALIIKTWNNFVTENHETKLIRYNPSTEKFPLVITEKMVYSSILENTEA